MSQIFNPLLDRSRHYLGAARIAYVVHDVNDAAVSRRIRMLHEAGASVTLIGFRRDDREPETVEGARVVTIGRTRDAALMQRAAAVMANIFRPAKMLQAAEGVDVIIGRNLEALALAARVRRGSPSAVLVYECLDIHRTLVGKRFVHRLIRRLEAALLSKIDLLLISSPAFMSAHFAKRASLTAATLLLENKVLALDGKGITRNPAPAGPPYVIGWFGNLRCQRSFRMLRELAQALDGRVKVMIAGRPSPAEFSNFEQTVLDSPHCRFVGSYGPNDLPSLYGQCHFAWAIDYFEEGLNSRWLLPNRLYEAASYGVVPIALKQVETGHWLYRHRAGLLLNEDVPVMELREALYGMQPSDFGQMRNAVESIPDEALLTTQKDCDTLMRSLRRERRDM